MPDLNTSLNDAAVLLIQIEPDDLSELGRLQEILDQISGQENCPGFLREKITRAASAVRGIVETRGAGTEKTGAVIKEVGQIIEETMDALPEEGESPAYLPEEETHPDEPLENETDISDENKRETETSEEPADPPPEQKPEPVPGKNNYNDEPEGFMPTDADPDLVAAFITESSDLISTAEEALLTLETDPDDMDAISTVFRAFHTVKGTSAFLELSLISELAHHSESFLSRIRDREIRYTGGYPDLALRALDMLKDLIRSVQHISAGAPFYKPGGYNELMDTLGDPESAGISGVSGPPDDNMIQESEEAPSPESEAEHITDKTEEESEQKDEAIASHKLPPKQEEKPEGKIIPSRSAKSLVESSVRVPIDRLDRFIDMVGELVVAHSMVVQDEVVAQGGHHELVKKVTLTSKIVRELQNMSMSMRMIPLKATFRKMARLVRDLARKAGKNVRFITEGEDTEIDRNMVDIINDPLVHLVRNSVDHGIELPEIRDKLGKSRYGIIRLSARHSAGNVVVEIRDDGKGLERDAIFKKGVQSGLIDAEASPRAFTDEELFGLIFEPGFSTAKIVSEVSGRGVGMNVVKTNIEALRGQIEIQSAPGKGSTFRMSLPLTLAIIDGMVVRVGQEKYVIPTISIVRSIQPDPRDLSTVLKKGETLTLQGKLVPLFRLADLFQINGAETELSKSIVMVVEDDGRQAGILIDELIGSQQIVIKTLGEMMRNIPGISGSAIMPNGRVGLILDVGGLVRLAHSGKEVSSRNVKRDA